ncbi:hypothetical protein FFW73_22320 [Escherichia coli]|nr:hypothetical protein [Escherichia coli]
MPGYAQYRSFSEDLSMNMEEIVALSVKHNVCYLRANYTALGQPHDEQNHTIRLSTRLKSRASEIRRWS